MLVTAYPALSRRSTRQSLLFGVSGKNKVGHIDLPDTPQWRKIGEAARTLYEGTIARLGRQPGASDVQYYLAGDRTLTGIQAHAVNALMQAYNDHLGYDDCRASVLIADGSKMAEELFASIKRAHGVSPETTPHSLGIQFSTVYSRAMFQGPPPDGRYLDGEVINGKLH